MIIRHAPSLKGGTIDGSVQVMLGENIAADGGVAISRDLLVPGMPNVRINGKPAYGGTIDGTGSPLPSDYQVTVGGNTALRNVVRRTNPLPIPGLDPAPTPAGTRSVTLTSPRDPASLDFATLRSLTLNGNAGQVAVPPGAYGDFTANARTGFTLGVAGSTQPTHYAFQRLNLSAGSQIQLVGPVIITVANALTSGGAIGSPAQPSWLTLNIVSGGLTLTGSASVDGYINAPAGTISLGGSSRVTGGLAGDGLSLSGNPTVQLRKRTVTTPTNTPPTVDLTAPADGTLFTAPAAMRLAATASDADGTVTKVEFFHGANKIGEAAAPVFELDWSNVPPGTYALTAKAHDNAGATATSLVRNVTVQIGLPYFTGFESSDGYAPGPLAGQLGWTATGPATIVEGAGLNGSRATQVGGGGTGGQARHGFPSYPGATLAFVDFFAKPAAGSTAATSVFVQGDAAHAALVRTGDIGEVFALNGNGAGGGTWIPTGFKTPLGTDGRPLAWLRVSLREDFTAKRWDLYVNGRLVAAELGFADLASPTLAQITLGGAEAGSLFDEFFAGFDNPLFVDADRDGMDDAWETQHGLNPLGNDRLSDLDGDGVLNIHEYRFGTRPNHGDTDGDGLPDAWELQYGLSPIVAGSPTDDADGDGLTNQQEFTGGTNPVSADTDADGIPDGWELQHGLNPNHAADASADADGDGKTSLAEFQGGTNPNDFYDGVLPNLISLVGANLRPGPNGMVSVRVERANGTVLPNAPVTLDATSGGILISTSPLGTSPAAAVALRSDAQGIASVYVQYPTPPAPLSTLVAKAQSGAQTTSLPISLAPPIVDSDSDGLDDAWEQKYLGTLGYAGGEDPGAVGRTLSQSHLQNTTPWPLPLVANGLQVWYRADMGVTSDASNRVNLWADVSGNSVHSSQANSSAQPLAVAAAAGSKPVVRFNGSMTILRSAAINLFKGSTDITVIAVVRTGGTQVTWADIIDYDHATAPFGGFVLQQNGNSLNEYALGWRNQENTGWEALGNTMSVPAGPVHCLSVVKSPTTQTGYLNGEQKFAVGLSPFMSLNPPRVLALGNFASSGGRAFNGDIAEVLIYNRALSPAERTQIETALQAKYASP